MQRLGFLACIGLFIAQVSLGALAIDELAVIKNLNEIKQLKQDNRDLLGRIEQLQQQQTINQKKITELFNLLEYKASSTTTKAVVLKFENADRAAKKVYTNARSLLLTEQYQQAIDGFQDYLGRYPDNTQISDVTYWLGKAYTAKGDYQNGKKTFVDFQENYPQHSKFPNSLYELAFVHYQLKNNQAALALLKTMIKKFPNHRTTTNAKDLLLTIEAQTTDNKTNAK